MEKEEIIAYFKGINYSDIWVQGLIAGVIIGVLGCYFLRRIISRVQDAEVNGLYLRRWTQEGNTNLKSAPFWNAKSAKRIKLTMDEHKRQVKIRITFQLKILAYAAVIIGMGILTCMWFVAVMTEG